MFIVVEIMATIEDDERTHLLSNDSSRNDSKLPSIRHEEQDSTADSQEDPVPVEQSLGERLPYNDYTTIDWLHDLVSLKRDTLLVTN